MKSLCAISFLACFLALSAPAQNAQPDTLFVHGDIFTGAHLRASDSAATPARVTALAISKGRIVAVGTDAEMLKLRSGTTRVIDLNGAFAMPGFNDAHTHIASARPAATYR